MMLHKLELGTEVIHFYGTEGGWFYKAACGDDDYSVDVVNFKGQYVMCLGFAPTLAASVELMEKHQATLIDNTKPKKHPSYRVQAEGRRL